MAIPTIDDAHDAMRGALGGAIGNVNIGVQYHTAVLGAAVANATAESIRAAVAALTEAVGGLREAQAEFTRASDRGTQELVKWSERTADATAGLKLATWALVAAMIVQIVVMLLTAK